MHQTRLPWLTLGAGMVVLTAVLGGGAQETARGETPKEFLFDWHEVAAADSPPTATLQSSTDGLCSGTIRTRIHLEAESSGTRSLRVSPVGGEKCTYQAEVKLYMGDGEVAYRQSMGVPQPGEAIECLEINGCVRAWNPPPDGQPLSGSEDVETVLCRLVDGWSYTGNADPATIVYTRVYDRWDLCYDGEQATLSNVYGTCFANGGASWDTYPEECYYYGGDVGPRSFVYTQLHGYFESSSTHPDVLQHDMYNTLLGFNDGGYTCEGSVDGTYDGVFVDGNCGATVPEPEL